MARPTGEAGPHGARPCTRGALSGHARGSTLARPAPSEQRSKRGKVFRGSVTVRRTNRWARKRGVDSPETAVRRWSGGVVGQRGALVFDGAGGLSVAGNDMTESCGMGRERGR
jgi:hypothetical protein